MILSSALADFFNKGVTTVSLSGWVNSRRDHGGLIFVDLRDFAGLAQLVFQPDEKDIFAQADKLRSEWVIEIEGELRARPQDLVNEKLATGHLEIKVSRLTILNRSATPPINVSDQLTSVHEDKRLLYRYLDLRRPKMQANLALRAAFYKFIRHFMESRHFMEIPTPILANSSPEGARDFLVPSRLHPQKFYALPQAPQQFKQLLMVGGVQRYYQIASCFRDEDPRADRLYGDFYQLDLEMSFVKEAIEVRRELEPFVKSLIVDFGKLKLHRDDIAVLNYDQAVNSYGTDKPDLRFEMPLYDLADIFKGGSIKIFADILSQGGHLKALVAEQIFSRQQIENLTKLATDNGLGGLAYVNYQAGECKGPLAKFLDPDTLKSLCQLTGFAPGKTIFFAADLKLTLVNRILGILRHHLGDILQLKDDKIVSAVWITDFPFYEEDENGGLAFSHNPFSKPIGDLEQEDKLALKADQFDLVLNGYEVCSGAARNHDSDKLKRAFQIAGYKEEDVEAKFGALMTAFKYGAPPHGGCAFGLDRILMILNQESNIREMVAFPKNGAGIDLMMSSPADIDLKQKKELGL